MSAVHTNSRFNIGRYAIVLLTALFLLSAFATPGRSQEVGSFKFDGWDGPAITVHFAEPAGLPPDAPIVFVMHGVQRNADDYRDNWISLAQQFGFAIYAPEFDAARFPGAQNYNLGGVGTDCASAFDAIEPLFDAVLKRRNTNQDSYVLFGHSAGAQYVHRYVLFSNSIRLELAIAANAGWYTMAKFDADWPYGLGGVDVSPGDLKQAFSKSLLIFLGDADNDPNAPYLRKTREAEDQGPHRLARGRTFIDSAARTAANANVPFNWRTVIINDVGHDNGKMAEAAAPLISQKSK